MVKDKLSSNPKALSAIVKMHETDGAPNVVHYDKKSGLYTIMDCSLESPKGRRSWCYDQQALEERKEHKPQNAALNWCTENNLTMLDEADYRYLQSLINIDLKTSTWLLTPEPIRALGGAIFGDKRYNQVFIYHNGASSYYASRGVRTKLTI